MKNKLLVKFKYINKIFSIVYGRKMNFSTVCWQKMHALKFRGKKKNLVKFKSTVYGRKMHALKV